MTEASAIRIAADGTLHCLGVAGAVAVDVDQLATDHPLTVVVPGADVLLCEVDLPPVRQAARRLQAARFALEERLATPVEDLHLVLGPRSAGGRYPVAVVAHERMEEWLQALGGAREAVVAMVPDYLCLPQPASAETIAWCTDDEVLVRREALSGFACEASLCPLLLRPAQEPGRLILRANGHQALASELAGLGYSLSREDQTPPAVACQALLQQAALRPALNLWSGPYAASTDDNPWWRPLRATAALALGWLALATAAQALVYQDLSARL
ncbi:MAG: type II secretion system protein GspL, partial [Salinisphaera sp.]|nr:type II secretion system protein GspL [Salinisphaera sp.]